MNRMHYASRTMEGVYMAEIAARNLRRHLPGGDGRDATSRNSIVNINLTGRKLTDEGFNIFIDALLETLQKEKDNEHPKGFARLFELHLGGNCLTVKSLPKLGMAIRLSTGDLKNLDLSQNCIEVSTAGQRAAWKYFLNSFEDCYMLKRVDFSENPLGTPGVEILARIYIRSNLGTPHQDTAQLEKGHDSNGSDSPGIDDFPSLSISDKGRKTSHSGHRDPIPQPQGRFEIPSRSDRRHFHKTRGLRSVAELILTGIPMSPVGVIHLASILSIQESREFLYFYLPRTKVGSEIEKKTPSISWDLNEHLPQKVRQLPSWAIDIAQQAPSFNEHSLAAAIDKLEAPPSMIAPRKGRLWRGRSDMKFRWVTKQLCALGTESEIRDSEIWGITLKMVKVMGTVLFNEKVIHAQISSGGKLFQCLGLDRDLVDAINIGLFRGKLSGKDSREWRLGMSLDIWSDIMGMALDKGDILTVEQTSNILEYVGAMGDRPMPEKAEICQFLFDVDCLMYQS